MTIRTLDTSRLRLASRFLGLRWRGRCDLAHGLPEGALVFAGAVLTRRVHELLALAAGVGLRLLGLWHGLSLTDLSARREVRHG
jgi:hypothetical protein